MQFKSNKAGNMILCHSDWTVRSHFPLVRHQRMASHPDADGCLQHQGRTHKVLMKLHGKAIIFRRLKQMTWCEKRPKRATVGIWAQGSRTWLFTHATLTQEVRVHVLFDAKPHQSFPTSNLTDLLLPGSDTSHTNVCCPVQLWWSGPTNRRLYLL